MKKSMVLKMEVKGLEDRVKINKETNTETHYTQLQTFEMKNEKLVKHTLKLNKTLSDKEKKDLIDNVIVVNEQDNLNEYQIDDFTKTYSCDNYKIIKEDLETPFMLEKEISFKVDNIQEKDSDYVFQTLEKIDYSIKLFDVKVKDQTINPMDFMGKNVVFKGIRETKFNGKTYYSTQSVPSIVK